MFVALDGNFQLRRRKANKDDEERFVCDKFFLADTLQDRYDKTHTSGNRSESNQCDISIKVADNTFTSRQLSSFNETGLVGSTCGRHTIPLEFTNMFKSGEKYVGH